MSAGVQHKGGKKNRKHGRQAKRSLSHARYTAEARWLKNKARRVAKEKARQAACRKVREAAGEEGPKLSDISRRVRKAA